MHSDEDRWCAEALRDLVGVRRLHDDVLEDVSEVTGPRQVADLLHEVDGGEEKSSSFPVVSRTGRDDGEVLARGRGRPKNDGGTVGVRLLDEGEDVGSLVMSPRR